MSNLPAHLQNYKRGAASASLESLTRLATGAQPYISIAGNRLRAIDAVGEEQMIGDIDRKTGIAYANIVIIDANPNVSKVYYDKPYDPNASEFVPPTCWSDNGIAPSAQAQSPQCRSCAECPLNVWGSATSKASGKQIKACNDTKKVAVYVPELPGMGAFLLRVPPASLREIAEYSKKLFANNATPAQVVTKLSFHPEGLGMLTFTPIGWIDEQTMLAVDAIDEVKLDQLVGKKDTPRTAALPPPGGSGGQGGAPAQIAHSSAPPPNKPPEEPKELFADSEPKPTQNGGGVAVGQSPEEIAKAAVAAYIAQQAAASQDAPKEEPPKRTRRTKAEMEAERAAKEGKPATQEQDMFGGGQQTAKPAEEKMEIPAFLNGGQAGATTTLNGGASRIQTPSEPPDDLKAALDAAFSLDL